MRNSFLFYSFLWCLLLGLSFTTIAQNHSIGRDQDLQINKTEKQIKIVGDPIDLQTTAFGTDAANVIPDVLTEFDLPGGTIVGTIGSGGSALVQGGDFGPGDLYFGTQNNNQLINIDITTGAFSVVAPITGITSGQTITGVAYDEVNDVMYLGTTDITTSQLFTINPSTGVATLVGTIGQPGLITIAINCTGEMYSADLVDDNLWSINTSTGVGTQIGPLGIDINFCQDFDFDSQTGELWFAAYSGGGLLGTINLTTGAFTTVSSFPASEFCSFAVQTNCGPPCPVGAPTNPSPANGATNVPLTGNTASWTNSAGTTMNEVYFNGILVYDGPAITSLSLAGVEPLTYNTTYTWRVKCKDNVCGTFGPTWSFTTLQDPNLVTVTIDVYPQNTNYWTGTCNSSAKTQVSLVNAIGTELGWMAFDVSGIFNDPTTVIEEIIFNGYLYANAWPYWSITPMGSVNPITATASEIYTQVSTNYDEGIAYSYNTEAGALPLGWLQRPLETTAPADLKNALGQGWFAIGIVDWDFSTSFYVNFQGWAEANKPYLTVTYSYVIPVELTSFTANVSEGLVELSWITATETNNQGFEVQRSSGGEFEAIAFINGYGTTTEPQAYSYTDKIDAGSYSYRLKQIDFNGAFEYSDIVEVEVLAPAVFALDQNYPNPFNPSTKIAFRLAVDSKVSLKVFDVLGQEVASLVNTNLAAGSHNIDFDASSLNSGVYFYRIEATGIDGTDFVDVKKMILTK